jgi:hypothetical protein
MGVQGACLDMSCLHCDHFDTDTPVRKSSNQLAPCNALSFHFMLDAMLLVRVGARTYYLIPRTPSFQGQQFQLYYSNFFCKNDGN